MLMSLIELKDGNVGGIIGLVSVGYRVMSGVARVFNPLSARTCIAGNLTRLVG